jgi:predicted protein tyrosine phosphatase
MNARPSSEAGHFSFWVITMLHIRYVSEAMALELKPTATAAMISITESGRHASLEEPDKWGALLRVQFADAEYDHAMMRRLEGRGKAFDPEAKGFPCRRHAEAIRAFLEGLQGHPQITDLIVHCHAGKRRSVAVAKFASEYFSVTSEDDYSGHNRTVYALLRDPGCMDVARSRRSLGDWIASLWRGS